MPPKKQDLALAGHAAVALMEAARPWERQPGESEMAFRAFVLYRDLLPEKRTHKAVGKILNKSTSNVGAWSAKFNWRERAIAWDGEKDRIRRAKQLDDVAEMNDRHATYCRDALEVLGAPGRVLLKQLKEGTLLEDLDHLKPEKALSLLSKVMAAGVSVMRAERLARGEATDRVDGQVTVQTVRASSEKLLAIALTHIPEENRGAFLTDVERCFADDLGLEMALAAPREVQALPVGEGEEREEEDDGEVQDEATDG